MPRGRSAVAAMTDLVLHSSGKPVPLQDVAQRLTLSLSYLEQLFSQLKGAGLVVSTRGPGGGFVTSRPASEILIGDIIRAVEAPAEARRRARVRLPVVERPSPATAVADTVWQGIEDHLADYLESLSLGELVDRRVFDGTDVFAIETPRPETSGADA
jgi:Rrf2 family iron-sulfur cluster assembly transcriptional regulator